MSARSDAKRFLWLGDVSDDLAIDHLKAVLNEQAHGFIPRDPMMITQLQSKIAELQARLDQEHELRRRAEIKLAQTVDEMRGDRLYRRVQQLEGELKRALSGLPPKSQRGSQKSQIQHVMSDPSARVCRV